MWAPRTRPIYLGWTPSDGDGPFMTGCLDNGRRREIMYKTRDIQTSIGGSSCVCTVSIRNSPSNYVNRLPFVIEQKLRLGHRVSGCVECFGVIRGGNALLIGSYNMDGIRIHMNTATHSFVVFYSPYVFEVNLPIRPIYAALLCSRPSVQL